MILYSNYGSVFQLWSKQFSDKKVKTKRLLLLWKRIYSHLVIKQLNYSLDSALILDIIKTVCGIPWTIVGGFHFCEMTVLELKWPFVLF